MSLIAPFGLFNGFMVLLLIVLYNFQRNTNRVFLALSIFFVWYTLFIVYLTLTKQILNYAALHRTGFIAAYLAIPFLYIYSRNTFYPGKLWRRTDWIFLLPAVIYLIDYLPFFIMPAEQKISILQENLTSDGRIFLTGEGWLGLTGLYFPFAYVWTAVIMYFQWRLIFANRKLKNGFNSVHNRSLFNFIVIITLLFLPIFIPGIFGVLFRLSWFNPGFIGFTFGLSISAISIYLFISPKILYGFIPEKKVRFHHTNDIVEPGPSQTHLLTEPGAEERNLPVSLENITRRYANSRTTISNEEIAAETEMVLQHMKEQRPFLKMGYSIQDLSNETGIPIYQLSPLINGHFNMNFTNWVNRFRIEYLIEQVPENPQLTLEAISKKAGFISRSTFINAFKKEKGVTPRDFFKGQKITV